MGRAFRHLLAGLGALCLAFPALPAAAQKAAEPPETYDMRSFTCPIGGEKFKHDVGYSAYPIELPDGSWLGDFQIGTQVPVCPGNGLVLIPKYDPSNPEAEGAGQMEYPDYSPAELAQLPALIASDEYKRLAADGPYLQAYWLATKLGRPAYGRFQLLQRATWATRDPAQRQRLVERFTADAPALVEAARLPPDGAFRLQFTVANALRELARFDEAKVLYDKYFGEKQFAADVSSTEGSEQSALARAIAERDDGWFAAETVPAKVFGQLCSGKLIDTYGPFKPVTQAGCKLRADREARQEKDDQAAFEESAELKQDLPALRTKCAATPDAMRTKGLKFACDALKLKEDSIAGDKLAQDGPALAAACEATPADRRNGPLSSGCIGYGIASTSALSELLRDDPEAYAILCKGQEGDHWADEAYWVVSACDDAARALVERTKTKLMLDLPALDTACTAKREDDYSNPGLGSACMQRRIDLDDALEQSLASDPAAFAAMCGKFNLKAQIDYDSEQSDAISTCRDAMRRHDLIAVEAKEKAKGLQCVGEPDDRMCASPTDVTADKARRKASKGLDTLDPRAGGPSVFDDNSSLMQAARVHAAKVIAEAKRTRTYPKRQPGDWP